MNRLKNRHDKYWLNKTVKYDYKAKLRQAKSSTYADLPEDRRGYVCMGKGALTWPKLLTLLMSLAVPVLLHPQELFQVRDEQRSRRAELSPEFSLCSIYY